MYRDLQNCDLDYLVVGAIIVFKVKLWLGSVLFITVNSTSRYISHYQ